MREEILVNITPQETRAVLVEGGVLQELYVERDNRRGIVGNIYKGRVSRVLPGMQAAFIEIGLERTAFLHASDIVALQNNEDHDDSLEPKPEPQIGSVLREGGDVLVQVVKDPLGSKGARLTTHISLPSRYMVYMPQESHVGVSSRIEDEQERNRLRVAVEGGRESADEGGYIVRTAGEGAPEEALRADMQFLRKLWAAIREKKKVLRPPALIHGDLPLTLRILRDLLSEDIDAVRVDSPGGFVQAQQFSEQFFPQMAERIVQHTDSRPLFDLYDVEGEIRSALERKVNLKSGGHLVFDQTEAMTTVDVNTGGFVGYRNLEETIFKTNLEAVQTICRQLRLRNQGGIVIIDFIDMVEAAHREQVMSALEKELQKDKARTAIYPITPLGIVEMTRKRTRESLSQLLCDPCPSCDGTGVVRSVETIVYDIFREIMRSHKQFDSSQMLVLASQAVIDYLLTEEAGSMGELEAQMDKPIRLQAESQYLQDQYDVVLV